MDPRKFQIGVRVLVDPDATICGGCILEKPEIKKLPAVITGIGKRQGLKGIQTPVYVKLESNGQQISVPAAAVMK